MATAIITANLPDIEQRKAPVEQVGLVVSTCGTPAYVHLQLEAARRQYGQGGIPLLVVNDGDTDKHARGRLESLCTEYGADFDCAPYHGHAHGDLRSFARGLEWANALGLQLLAKFSRRFIPLRHWRHEVMSLGAINQHACAFGRWHDDNPHGLFRTDAICLRVQKWLCGRVQDTFNEALSDRKRNVNVENIFAALMKALGGYEIWPLVGRDFYRAHKDAIQWRGVLPSIYADFAREWELPYEEKDFQDGGTGTLIQNEEADLTPELKAKARLYSPCLTEDAITKAREWEFERRCNDKASDIREHLPLIRKLSAECEHVTEFGVRHGNSTVALLCGNPKKMVCYDVFFEQTTYQIQQMASPTELHFVVGDSRKVDIEETDLLMIDTYHTYEQLRAELSRHSQKARKYIVLHDTVAYGAKGEDGSVPGLRRAVIDVLEDGQEWRILHDLDNDNGLMVLERLPVKEKKSWDWPVSTPAKNGVAV